MFDVNLHSWSQYLQHIQTIYSEQLYLSHFKVIFSSYQRGSWGFVGMISKELWDTEEYYVLSSQICVKVLPHVYKRLLNKFGLPWWGCLPHLTDFESSFGFRRSRMLNLTLNIFWNSSERRFYLFAFLFWWLHSF